MDLLLLIALLFVGFIVAFAIGSNNESMAPAVGARVFSVTTAVLLGAVIDVIGAILLGGCVSE